VARKPQLSPQSDKSDQPSIPCKVSVLRSGLQDGKTGRPQFDSGAMGCAYHEYRRKDVLQCLARPKGQAALVMIGERASAMRCC
jgi:hypothetical protein